MPAFDTARQLTAFERRGAGTDAERRAAAWLAAQIGASRRRARVETFWCRPNGALAQAWHVLLAIVGSLLAVHHAALGGAIVAAALLCVVGDAVSGYSIGRRLTREHASQNVVSWPATAPGGESRTRLIVTANYDAGRAGVAYRNWLRVPVARGKRLAGRGRLTPGWLGWLVIAMVWLLVVAALRHGGATGTPIGVVHLIPTAGLVIALALLLELGSAPFGPAAGDNAAGSAVALALVRALDVAPPAHLDVELVLQGAGEPGMIGLKRHLRARRSELRAGNTIVLGVAAAGAGQPRWWASDGPLVPLPALRRLRALAERTSAADPAAADPAAADPVAAGPNARPHHGRGTSPTLPARMRRLPALTIGCLDDRGLAPRSHQPGDQASALEPAALDALLQYGLMLVDAIDADLSRRAADRSRAAPTTA